MIRTRIGTLYTGIANDFTERWLQHHKGIGAKYIRSNGFANPVYLQEFKDKSSAMKREIFIKKQSKEFKEGLIGHESNLLLKNPNFELDFWRKVGGVYK